MLAALLEEEGHWVFTADDGPSAIEHALSEEPDIILLDIGMPGMDGYAVARRLRQEPALEGTMLVAVTGYGQDEDRERAIAAGFEHHLVKPVDLDALRRVDESRTPLGVPYRTTPGRISRCVESRTCRAVDSRSQAVTAEPDHRRVMPGTALEPCPRARRGKDG